MSAFEPSLPRSRPPLPRAPQWWVALPAAAVLLAGCTSTPGTTTPVATAISSSASSTVAGAGTPASGAGTPAQAPATPAGADAAATDPDDTGGGPTYTDDGAVVTLVSDSFTGDLSGYRVVDGTDTLDMPDAIAVSADGSELYLVTGDGPGAHLIRLRDGMDRWDLLGTSADPGADSVLEQPVDVAVGTDRTIAVLGGAGRLWVSRDDAASWVEIPPPAGGVTPSGVAVTATGAIVVSDAGADRIASSPDGGATWDVVDRAAGSFATPVDVAVSPDGTLVVLNEAAGLSLLRPGAASWESVPADIAGWTSPVALTIGPAGDLYVGDPASGALYRSPDGGRTWSGSTGFAAVADVAVGPDGQVYVSDGINTLLALQPTPGPVGGLTAIPGPAPGDILVTWTAPAATGVDATSYRVGAVRRLTEAERADLIASLRGSDPDAPETGDLAPQETSALSATLTGVPTGRAVTVSVVAVNGAGVGTPTETTVTLP